MIYQKYIFKNNLRNFCLILVILIFLVWFSRAIVFIDLVIEKGIATTQFLQLFILILPWIMLYILPFSLLVANIISINNMQQNSEITAIKSFGISNLDMAKAIILLGLVVSVIAYSISFYFMPYANRQLRLFRNDLRDSYSKIAFKPGNFEAIKNVNIYAQKRDGDRLFGLFIHDQRSKSQTFTITAESAMLDTKLLLLSLNNGTLQRINHQTNKTDILYFEKYLFSFDDSKNNSENGIFWKANERYFYELLYPESNLPEKYYEKIKTEIHQRIIFPLTPLIFSLISAFFLLKNHSKRDSGIKNIVFANVFCFGFFILSLISESLSQANEDMVFLRYVNCFCFLLFPFLMIIHADKNN